MIDAVDKWLNTPPISSVTHGLQYWTAMAASGHPLAPMAKNFLSVPGIVKLHNICYIWLIIFVFSYINGCGMRLSSWRFDSIEDATFTF